MDLNKLIASNKRLVKAVMKLHPQMNMGDENEEELYLALHENNELTHDCARAILLDDMPATLPINIVSVAKRTVCKINMTDCKHMGKNNRCDLQAPGECSLQTER